MDMQYQTAENLCQRKNLDMETFITRGRTVRSSGDFLPETMQEMKGGLK
jgi:hypothetical protein